MRVQKYLLLQNLPNKWDIMHDFVINCIYATHHKLAQIIPKLWRNRQNSVFLQRHNFIRIIM